jgi:hypothetical protein
VPPASSRRGPPWVGAAELGEYAYCPRAWYYRGHPPEGPPDPESIARQELGATFHARALTREVARERSTAGLVAAALLLLLLGALLLYWAAGL